MPARVRFPRPPRALRGERPEPRRFADLPPDTLVVPLVPLGPWSDIDPPRSRLSKLRERWEEHARDTLSALRDKLEMKLPADAAKTPDARLLLADGDRELEVFRASGGFRWRRRTADEDADDVPAQVPDDPIAEADAFLASRGLTDSRAEAVEVHSTEITRMTMNGKFTTYPIETHVEYRFRIQGLPVFGPGGKMRVTFGKDGAVSGLLKFFRAPGPAAAIDPGSGALEAVPSLRPLHETAHFRSRLRQDPSFARLCTKKHVSVRDVSLGYYAAPPRYQQDALVPVFAFDFRTRVKWEPRYEAVRYISACRHLAADWDRLGAGVFDHVRR